MELNEIPLRIAKLRSEKGVSAREMSLDIGQNENYITMIEGGKALPSMQGLFYICEYLDITPSEFFDTEAASPTKITAIANDLKGLTPAQLDLIAALVKEMKK